MNEAQHDKNACCQHRRYSVVAVDFHILVKTFLHFAKMIANDIQF